MLVLLDHIFLQPLMEIYSFLFGMISESYGVGTRILLFAAILNLLLVPVYSQMEKQNRRLLLKRAQIEEEARRLKRHFKGRERYFYLRTLYRQNNYKHWKVILSSADLFIQILVFATVYRFLANLDVLQGASFGPISDLGQPDEILGGINFLPLLMTLINAISLSFYVRQGSKLYQGIGLAVVFLVILYPSAAGLVLYWTANNLFSLIRNLVARKKSRATRDFEPERRDSSIEFESDFAQTETGFGQYRFSIFILSCATSAFLIYVWVPITTFLTSPGEIGFHLDYLITNNAKNAMIWVYLSGLIYAFASILALKDKLAKLALGLFATLVIYAYALPFGYPMLTGLAFELPPFSSGQLMIRALVDLAFIFVLFFGLRWAFTKWSARSLLVGIVLCNLSLLTAAGIGLYRDDIGGYGSANESTFQSNSLLHFSRNQPNTLVLFLDRFMGSFVESILEDEPTLAARLDGFIWYPRTISSGQNSIAGIHPIFGGYDYVPQAMNARNQQLRHLSVEAYSILPYNFAREGYQVHFIEPNGLGFTMTGDCNYLDMPGVNCGHISKSVVTQKAEELDFSIPELSRADYADLLTLLALMRTMPYTIKSLLQEYGPWRTFMDHSAGTTFTVWSKLKALPQLTTTDSTEPNLNIFLNILPHEPYYLPEDCVPSQERFVVSPDEIEAQGHFSLFSLQHENAARCSLLIVADYLDYLKEEGVYDNTEIVIVSDHGIVGPVEDRSTRAIAGGTTHNLYVRSRSVLLIKERGSTGELGVSETFLPNAEVPGIVCRSIGGCENPYLNNRSLGAYGRDDPFVVSFVPWQFSAQESTNFVIEAQYEVRNGDPYNSENWRKIE